MEGKLQIKPFLQDTYNKEDKTKRLSRGAHMGEPQRILMTIEVSWEGGAVTQPGFSEGMGMRRLAKLYFS